MEQVFDMSNKSESVIEGSQSGMSKQHRDSISSQGSAASFNGHDSDRRGRRQRLRQKLKEKEQQRQQHAATRGTDDDESEGASAYLPANMATPKGSSPVRSGAEDGNDASKELMLDTDDQDDDEERRSSALSYVKKQLKNKTSRLKNEVNVVKEKVKSYRDHQNQSSSTQNETDSEQEHDPYNKKPVKRSESKKGVGQKLKGLFGSKNKNKKHAQMLGDTGESDSESGR